MRMGLFPLDQPIRVGAAAPGSYCHCLSSGAPGQCSSSSHAVTLDPPLTFICPQPSTWEHTPPSGPLAGQHLVYRFRNQDGLFVGDGAHFNFIPPHAGSSMHLYTKSCEQMGTPPVTSEVYWLDIYEGTLLVARVDPASINKPWIHFNIAMELADGVERDVIARLGCTWPGRSLNNPGAAPTESTTFSASLDALVDQQGVIFDVTQALDPAHPELSAVEGVTVTAMISDTAWGGWVPWSPTSTTTRSIPRSPARMVIMLSSPRLASTTCKWMADQGIILAQPAIPGRFSAPAYQHPVEPSPAAGGSIGIIDRCRSASTGGAGQPGSER